MSRSWSLHTKKKLLRSKTIYFNLFEHGLVIKILKIRLPVLIIFLIYSRNIWSNQTQVFISLKPVVLRNSWASDECLLGSTSTETLHRFIFFPQLSLKTQFTTYGLICALSSLCSYSRSTWRIWIIKRELWGSTCCWCRIFHRVSTPGKTRSYNVIILNNGHVLYRTTPQFQFNNMPFY